MHFSDNPMRGFVEFGGSVGFIGFGGTQDWMPDTGYQMPDAGYRILDAG